MMTPKELRDKWNLTNVQLAVVLGKSEKTVKAYMCQQNTKTYRNPPLTIKFLCSKLDKEWTQEGNAVIFLSVA